MFKDIRIPKRYGVMVFALLLCGLSAFFLHGYFSTLSPSYSQFKQWVIQDMVTDLTITETTIKGTFNPKAEPGGPRAFKTGRVHDPELVSLLEDHHIEFKGSTDGSASQAVSSFVNVLIFGLVAWFLWKTCNDPNGLMSVWKSKARMYMDRDIDVRFTDVAGVDEAKDELLEVVTFLKTPEKYTRLGGRIPKGVLLIGPPGTGKTLLAKAVAGEAGVPFFSISGSAFVEMFVGLGAARVRDLFQQARLKAPCLIFIDELDALGKSRDHGHGSHEEREHTLNQLLVEMDGFDTRSGVVVLAATNRPEILDAALLRPGRFDRHVAVSAPDRKGRLAILDVHARKVSLAPEVKLEAIAGMTPGMSGADLANMVNEAALLAARHDGTSVGPRDFDEAIERVVAGLEKKQRVLNRSERERVAHHEIGHALTALLLPGADPVHKISIIPRGVAALGYTMQVPTEDRFLATRTQLENKIAVLLSGLVAEEIIYGEISTGAHDDLRKATDIARRMVTDYGMSETLRTAAFDSGPSPLFLQKDRAVRPAGYSEETASGIDREVVRLLDKQKACAAELLTRFKPALESGAAILLEHEVITGAELAAVLEGFRPQPA